MDFKEALKSGVIGGCISGFMSGLIAGFMGLIVYMKQQTNAKA